jgi:hypothetical protein
VDECKPLVAGAQRHLPGRRPGRAVQVDPIKPTLRAPGTKRLKLNCDVLLSTSAFKFNLRRYTEACIAAEVGAARHCPPRHPTHLRPSFIELNDIL